MAEKQRLYQLTIKSIPWHNFCFLPMKINQDIMKAIKGFLFFTILSVITLAARAQDDASTQIKRSIESQQYIFIAEKLYPQSGMSRTLTGAYDLNISKNKLTAYLPYYGRVYTPMLNSDGGIKFTSTDFEYSVTTIKNGWEISIRPKDVPLVSLMQLSIFDNGSASLYVTSNNRESVNYSGKIKGNKTEGKRGF